MILIASNNQKLVNRCNQKLREKYPLHVVSQKAALKRAMSNLNPRVLSLDVGLPRLRAVRELPTIQQLSPVTSIIVLSTMPTAKEGIAVLRAGAKGYSSQRISAAHLDRAVKVVLRGELWAPRKTVSALVTELLAPNNNRSPAALTKFPLDGLSARKREIAMMAIDGTRNREIAIRLNITEATVKAHLSAIFRKFHVSRRFDLARQFASAPSEN